MARDSEAIIIIYRQNGITPIFNLGGIVHVATCTKCNISAHHTLCLFHNFISIILCACITIGLCDGHGALIKAVVVAQ